MNIHENTQQPFLTQSQPICLSPPRNLFRSVCLLLLLSVISCWLLALRPSTGACSRCWHWKPDVRHYISSSSISVLSPPLWGGVFIARIIFSQSNTVLNSKIQQQLVWENVNLTVALALAANNFQLLWTSMFLKCYSIALWASLAPASDHLVLALFTTSVFYLFEFYGHDCSYFPTCFCHCCCF